MFKVTLRKADIIFSKFIRTRDHWTCRRCGKTYSPDNARNLGTSHYWGRTHESTRFDPENCDALCNLPCHAFWGHGEGRDQYKAFKINQLGQERFDALDLRSHLYHKKDDAMVIFIYKKLLDELNATV
jgi:hypothetical protein